MRNVDRKSFIFYLFLEARTKDNLFKVKDTCLDFEIVEKEC